MAKIRRVTHEIPLELRLIGGMTVKHDSGNVEYLPHDEVDKKIILRITEVFIDGVLTEYIYEFI